MCFVCNGVFLFLCRKGLKDNHMMSNVVTALVLCVVPIFLHARFSVRLRGWLRAGSRLVCVARSDAELKVCWQCRYSFILQERSTAAMRCARSSFGCVRRCGECVMVKETNCLKCALLGVFERAVPRAFFSCKYYIPSHCLGDLVPEVRFVLLLDTRCVHHDHKWW